MNYKVVLALREPELSAVNKIFQEEGYTEIRIAENSLELILQCERETADILVLDMDFPFLDAVSTLNYLAEHRLAKLIVAVNDNWQSFGSTRNLEGVDIFVAKPVEARKIIPGLLVQLARKEKLEALERECEQAEEELHRQKISSYALRLLMDKERMSEEEAEEYLKKLAAENQKEIQEICEIIFAVLCNRKNTSK